MLSADIVCHGQPTRDVRCYAILSLCGDIQISAIGLVRPPSHSESKRVHRRRFPTCCKTRVASRVKTSGKPPWTHPVFRPPLRAPAASPNSFLSVFCKNKSTPPVPLALLPTSPAEESKQVHRHRFHLLQNAGCVKGQDERQAALDAFCISPTTPPPSGVSKLASL